MQKSTKEKPIYSDGDEYENAILAAYRAENPKQEVEKLLAENKWVYTYHLSNERENLLNWIDFNSRQTLLEVGAGCGAITGLFCQKLRSVVAVEYSERRLDILKNRHKEYNNLELVTGNIQDYKAREKFDFVTSIGVLEYSGRYIANKNPYNEFIRTAKQFLKPTGKLIIAIENRFGLKYWSGAPEDHTGRYFDGLENYPEDRGIKTFSKKELTKLLRDEGLRKIEFYYPTPDYKFPVQIFSDENLPTENLPVKTSLLPSYHPLGREYIFDEKKVMQGIYENDMFDFFANSFLVIASL